MRTHYRGWEILLADYFVIARKGDIVLEEHSSPAMDVPLLPAMKREIDRREREEQEAAA